MVGWATTGVAKPTIREFTSIFSVYEICFCYTQGYTRTTLGGVDEISDIVEENAGRPNETFTSLGIKLI